MIDIFYHTGSSTLFSRLAKFDCAYWAKLLRPLLVLKRQQRLHTTIIFIYGITTTLLRNRNAAFCRYPFRRQPTQWTEYA